MTAVIIPVAWTPIRLVLAVSSRTTRYDYSLTSHPSQFATRVHDAVDDIALLVAVRGFALCIQHIPLRRAPPPLATLSTCLDCCVCVSR
jgi:hypothetical protein